MTVHWRLQTPSASPGAIAVLALHAHSPAELDHALSRLGIAPVRVSALALRSLAGIDRGIVARWSDTSAGLMPHAGPAVTRALAAALAAAGIPEAAGTDPGAEYPEAGSPIEARMLAALAGAASPLAIDLLLDQPRRWNEHPRDPASAPTDRDRVLRRLIDPPLVVALGPPNVGKSTLVNALAGRSVSIVTDQPGTTRDHVGVTLECRGLVVRYADTPGLRPESGPLEADAVCLALELVSAADLVLRCGDASAPPPALSLPASSTLCLALRTDLGPANWPHDATVSARTGAGLDALATLIRDTLVPPALLADPAPWRFWQDEEPSTTEAQKPQSWKEGKRKG